MNFKNIHIGGLIENLVREKEIKIEEVCRILSISKDQITKIFDSEKLDTELLLKWSKLLEYDLFRFYSQHLVLYAPPQSISYNQTQDNKKNKNSDSAKHIYTKEIIEFIMELIDTGEKTKKQIIEEYRIPKTTLYKWVNKYKN